jgi:myo-inositol-1(or 4)-monophosphatase
MDSTLPFIENLAIETGQQLAEIYRRGDSRASLKADRTVVTEADIAADQRISAALQARFPSDHLLSEELRPGLQDRSTSSAPIWVIDPIDGTTNFSIGLPFWGVMIARLTAGWPDLGVMYFPILDELYSAETGRGAFFNHTPLHVRPPAPDRPASFFSCCARTHRAYEVSVPYKARILGSAGYSFCAVAHELAVLAFESTPKIWDIAAGWVLIHEAGGCADTLDGGQPFPFNSDADHVRRSYPTLIAPTRELLEQGRRQIRPKPI